MSWVTILWSMTASACLTLAAIHLLIWCQRRTVWDALLFTLSDDLRESEARMTLAAEAAGFGVWMWNIARSQVWGPERWLGLFEFAPETTVTYEDVVQRIHPDAREGGRARGATRGDGPGEGMS